MGLVDSANLSSSGTHRYPELDRYMEKKQAGKQADAAILVLQGTKAKTKQIVLIAVLSSRSSLGT